MTLVRCSECGHDVSTDARSCPHCGHRLVPAEPAKSDAMAGCLGLFLGPVGLWYKGHWAAGFAWVVMAILLGIGTGGILAPVCWIGMAIHAYAASSRDADV
jgi:hypothetical protein